MDSSTRNVDGEMAIIYGVKPSDIALGKFSPHARKLMIY